MSPERAEPVSPELVLVCPELREQALAAQPLLPWQAVAVPGPANRAIPQPAAGWMSHAAGEGVAALFQLARLAATVIVVCVALTLALTLVADMIR